MKNHLIVCANERFFNGLAYWYGEDGGIIKQKQPRTTYTSELRINVTFQLQRTILGAKVRKKPITT